MNPHLTVTNTPSSEEIQNPKSKIAWNVTLLFPPSHLTPSAGPTTTVPPAGCAYPTSASAINLASLTASTAALPNQPSYPAANAPVLTATNAENVSITLYLLHRNPNLNPNRNLLLMPPMSLPLINTLLQQGAAATDWKTNGFNRF